MQNRMQSRADLHVHSKYSDRPSEWFLRRIGAPESFVEPLELYRRARQRGMDFVTISDHNRIAGALDIAHLPGTFLSVEITTYFPEDGCKLHCLAVGITEGQFRRIDELRANLYELHHYLTAENIIASVTHPLFRVNDRLTIDHLEKLLVLFKRFEGVNGSRDPRASRLFTALCDRLTPELIERMADRHGLEPCGPEPWRKWLTGGSDDHSGAYAAGAYTVTPYADDVSEYLGCLQRGEHEPGGACGGSLLLGHSVYQIAYSYYQSRLLNAPGGKPNILGEFLGRLLEEPAAATGSRLQRFLPSFALNFLARRRKKRLNEIERLIVDEVGALAAENAPRDAASALVADRRIFHTAGRIAHTLGYSFLNRFAEHFREGRLLDSLQTIASLAPVALGVSPYLAAFSTQHKDDDFLADVSATFDLPDAAEPDNPRKAWITDTFNDASGVAQTMRTLGTLAKARGRRLTVVTCLPDEPATELDLKNFAPVGTFVLSQYGGLPLAFPPLLDVIEYLERRQFAELVVSTPGPLGLTALAAARVLCLPTVGVWHVDLPTIVRRMTNDSVLEQLTWKYVQWFYSRMDSVVVPNQFARRQLVDRGFDAAKISVMARGVDLDRFSPAKRQAQFWRRHGLEDGFTFVYHGRVAPDKNLDTLLAAFLQVQTRHRHVNLAVVGDGASLAELRARYRHSRLAFTGFLEGDELASALASSDALVFPATAESCGNAVLEAQAAGLPAIVSNRGAPPDIVGRCQSGLIVDEHTPAAFARAMDRLAADSGLHRRLCEAAQRNAAGCSWERVLDDFWKPARRRDTADRPGSAVREPAADLIDLEVA